MYLARFELNGRPIVQARVVLSGLAAAWRQTGVSTVATLLDARQGIGALDLSLRIALDAQGTISLGWAFTAEQQAEEPLRRFIAAFTRLEQQGAGTVVVPRDAATFDELWSHVPRSRARVSCGNLTRDGVPFPCDFRVLPHLDRLTVGAAARNARLTYQANIAEQHAPPTVLRSAMINALRIASRSDIPTAVARRQAQLATRLSTTSAIAEEYVATDPQHAGWLADQLRQALAEDHGELGVEDASPKPVLDAFAAELSEHCLHSIRFEDLPFDTIVAEAVDEATIRTMLAWSPPPGALAMLKHFVSTVDDDKAPDSLGPQPRSWAPGLHFFVSYAHADRARVRALVDRATEQASLPLWWDTLIPGGVEWDEHIEDRIRSSRGVLVFLSNAAVNSKWVRREVKYADAMGKPILPVDLEAPISLDHGLALLFGPKQRMRADLPDLVERLARAMSPD